MINTIKFILLTIVYSSALIIAFLFGWLDILWMTDTLHIAKGIFIVFVFYSLSAFWQVIKLDRELQSTTNFSERLMPYVNKLQSASTNKEIHIHNLELFIQSSIISIRRGSNSLVLLGLIGTITGFIIALGGVDPSTVGDSSKIASVIASLLHGMYIAFYTTLVGTILHFCLNLYNRVLDNVSTQVVNRIITTYVK